MFSVFPAVDSDATGCGEDTAAGPETTNEERFPVYLL